MRLHELAKEIGVSSKELLALAREIGLNIKSHSSNLAAGEESILRIAMKQELEEKAAILAAKEAEKKAAEEKERAAAKAAERAAAEAAGIELPEEEEETEETVGEAVEEPAEAGEEPATAEGEVEEALTATATAQVDEEAVSEPGVDTAEVEGAEVEDPEKEEKPARKIKKMPPKRPGATILGRIRLPSLDEMKKKAKAKEPYTGPRDSRVSAETEEIVDSAGRPMPAKGHTDAGDPLKTGEDDSKAKTKRYIKPKQQPVFFDPEDDPLLQGIRIRHWDKHMRARKSSWRPVGKSKRRMRKVDPESIKKVQVVPPLSLKNLSLVMGIKVQDILFSMMKRGAMAHINSMLEEEDVLQIAIDFNREVEILEAKDVEQDFLDEIEEQDSQAAMEAEGDEREFRSPIVAFLGHVDHGKTSLLDAIRDANIASTEDGGITQHVSAYKVKNAAGNSVVFLDTPGHRAFTEMRARGANTTDIVVLVVAADDGVMPQTEEAIQHAMAAGVPIVVAINKIDKANANTMRVKQQLAGLGVMTEDWGGEVGCVEVSAVKKEGLDELLDRLTLEAEIQELSCNPNQHARGVVFEARKDDEVGNVVTLLVQDGTLNLRDTVLAGDSICRVRALFNDQGVSIETAEPATPVNVIGFDTLPEAGDSFIMVENVAKAREIAELRKEKMREARMAPDDRYSITLENLFESIEAGKIKEIRVILKADVKGTLEVLKRTLGDMKHEEVKVKLLRDGLGDITEDDVLLALASKAIILGFHSVPDDKARKMADENKVDIRTYRVIYQLLDDMRAAMEGALDPVKKEKITAHLEIREVFKSSRLGNIAGCIVTDGTIHRSDRVRLKRNDEVLYEGDLSSLKRFKDDHREVKEGFECGVKIAGFDDVQEGDIIEAFEIVLEKRILEMD